MPPYSSPTPWELSHYQELSSKVERLQGTRATVCRMKATLEKLVQRRSLPLPHELMGIIFDIYVHHCGQLPETLLLVCRIWHVLALSQPTLWTNLDPLDQFDLKIVRPWAGTFLQSRIARSNPAPLKVNFAIRSLPVDMTLTVVRKVASIPTFRPRIQELVISRIIDINYLVGPQPLLESLTVHDPCPLQEVFASPKKFMLAEKKLTTLRLDAPPMLLVWPDSFLQRLHTLEVRLTGVPEDTHEYWTLIQKSTALRTIHIVQSAGVAPALSHPSIQHLSILYPEYWDTNQIYCLEEVRMPRLQELVIDTSAPKPLTQLKLIGAPILSLRLRLIWKPRRLYVNISGGVEIPWVDAIVHLLRSTSRLKRMEISASSSLVSDLAEAFEKDGSLCPELDSFVVDEWTGSWVEWDDKWDTAPTLEQSRGKVAALMEKRRSTMSTH
jgi:hypothetical protein